jgi:hypothetical protein
MRVTYLNPLQGLAAICLTCVFLQLYMIMCDSAGTRCDMFDILIVPATCYELVWLCRDSLRYV